LKNPGSDSNIVTEYDAMAEKISFLSDGYDLEGLLDLKSNVRGVVITHPHPLYGGDMYNYVVETIADAFQKKGYSTLRFNFRGVGKSQGQYDEGIGERQDVVSAINFLSQQGIKTIDLAGYSFGAYINAHVGCRNIRNMVMVSPPVNFMRFDGVKELPCLTLVVSGDEDEFASPDEIRRHLPVWNADTRFDIISDADHFYGGRLRELEMLLYSRTPPLPLPETERGETPHSLSGKGDGGLG